MTKDDSGFTLVDALTALLVISMAMAGLTAATHALGKDIRSLNLSIGEASAFRGLRRAFNLIPGDVGPFDGYGTEADRGLVGTDRSAKFPCGLNERCSLALVQSGGATRLEVRAGAERATVMLKDANVGFTYVSETGAVSNAWPAPGSAGRLTTMAVVDDRRPLAILKFAKALRASCGFDFQTGSCNLERGSADVGR